jgi:L-lactate dehydrogenase
MVKNNKVAIIGAGNVGSLIVNAMMLMQISSNVVLFNRNLAKAEGEAFDASDAVPLVGECNIHPTNSYEDLRDSSIVVVTVGAKRKEGQNRLELLQTNACIVKDIIANLDEYCPDAVIVVVSNPVDVITRLVIENSKRDKSLILGAGTILDTSRLRDYLAKALGVSRKNIHSHIVGEHGDSEFVLWSNSCIGAVRFDDFPMPEGLTIEQLKIDSLEATKTQGKNIISRKGYTGFGIAVSTAKLIKSILRDEKKILSVSTLANEYYGLEEGTVLSLPCIIGKAGIERDLVLTLTDDEKVSLQNSANVLNASYKSVVG